MYTIEWFPRRRGLCHVWTGAGCGSRANTSHVDVCMYTHNIHCTTGGVVRNIESKECKVVERLANVGRQKSVVGVLWVVEEFEHKVAQSSDAKTPPDLEMWRGRYKYLNKSLAAHTQRVQSVHTCVLREARMFTTIARPTDKHHRVRDLRMHVLCAAQGLSYIEMLSTAHTKRSRSCRFIACKSRYTDSSV